MKKMLRFAYAAVIRIWPGAARLVAHRWLLLNFLKRELTNRYVGSAGGWVWALVHPLLLLAVYSFVFTMVFRPPQLNGEHYLLFVAVALWPWLALQDSLLRGVACIQSYSGLIRKVAFPHEFVVYSTVGATFILHMIGYAIVLVGLYVFGQPVHPKGLPLALWTCLVLLVGTCGIAFALSALQVFLRDIEHVLGPALSILIYLAPIIYPLALVPTNIRPWVEANPFSFIVERLRAALIVGGSPWPVWQDAAALVVAAVVFVFGRWFFLRLSPYFEDFV